MPIEISWFDDEKTILFGNFVGDWTWEDYSQGFFDTIELAQGIKYRLDQIIDLSQSGAIPSGQAVAHINRNREFAKSLQIHLTVFVGANSIFRGLFSSAAITKQQKPSRLFVDSIEDAYALIKADREKLKDKPDT